MKQKGEGRKKKKNPVSDEKVITT